MSEYDDMSIDELIERKDECWGLGDYRTSAVIIAELKERQFARDAILEISEAMAEAGEVIAPAHPTMGMLMAGQTAWLNDSERKSSTLYQAMIEATPPPLASNATTEGGK